MNILTFDFSVFLLCSLILYYVVPKKFQWIVLLAANTVFYGFSGIGNFIFIVFSSAITFLGAYLVSNLNDAVKTQKGVLEKDAFKVFKSQVQSKKRIILVIMLLLNVGLLVYLKYWRVLFNARTLFLPLGISYYTLQTISYFMDVYNSKVSRERNFLKYFVFVSFFPQLIMGPINRYGDLGKQINETHDFDFENIKHGVMVILYGAMKKFIIADMLFARISDVLDPKYTNLPGCMALFGVLMYAVYQYADFSGGVDLVLGIAELFDIRMQPNFRQPYFSTSLSNFWQRWHISLGGWMRDYVFYPLALTKPMQNLSKWSTSHISKHMGRVISACIANIVVFVLVGIWHGPELHFLVWGLYNGLVIAFSDLLSPVFAKINILLKINDKSKGFHVFRIVRTFIIVNIGWYFDRIVDVKKSFIYLRNTFFKFGNPFKLIDRAYLNDIFGHITDFQSQIFLVVLGCIIVFAVSVLKENKVDVYAELQKKNIAVRWLSYYIPLILVIISLTFSAGDSSFMYAQY